MLTLMKIYLFYDKRGEGNTWGGISSRPFSACPCSAFITLLLSYNLFFKASLFSSSYFLVSTIYFSDAKTFFPFVLMKLRKIKLCFSKVNNIKTWKIIFSFFSWYFYVCCRPYFIFSGVTKSQKCELCL